MSLLKRGRGRQPSIKVVWNESRWTFIFLYRARKEYAILSSIVVCFRFFHCFYCKHLLLLTMYLRWGEYLNIGRATLLTRDYIYWGIRCTEAPFVKYELDFPVPYLINVLIFVITGFMVITIAYPLFSWKITQIIIYFLWCTGSEHQLHAIICDTITQALNERK